MKRKSCTGHIFFLTAADSSWASNKQSSGALVIIETEFAALLVGTREATYLKKVLPEIDFYGEQVSLIINEDNLSAQPFVNNPVYHSHSKGQGSSRQRYDKVKCNQSKIYIDKWIYSPEIYVVSSIPSL